MLVLTSGLDHPLTSRINFLVDFLLESQITLKVLDFSFYRENQSILACLENILSFPSKALSSTDTIIRFPSLLILGRNGTNWASFIHFLRSILAFMLTRIVTRSLDYNVVVSTDPIGALMAISAKKPNTFIVYEDLDCFEDMQLGKIQGAFVSFLEKLGLKRANLVVSVSKPLVRRARLLNLNCILVPNGVNLRCFPKPRETMREPFIVYAGSIIERAGLKLAIEAFPSLKRKIPWIKMKIVGDGKEKHNLEELVKTLSLQDSIFFVGKLRYDQMAALLSNSYIGIAMFKPGKAAAFASPLKLFDYMAAGMPIIATDIGDIGRIIKESKSGLAVKWDINEFLGAAEKLLTKRNLWLECHENGLRYVKKYDWDNLFDGWLQEIQNRVQVDNPFTT